MASDDFFNLRRQPLDWDESGPGNHDDFLGYSPKELTVELGASALGNVETTYEAVFSLERIPLDTPEPDSEGGMPKLPDSDYIEVTHLFDNAAYELVFTLKSVPLDTPVIEEEKETLELSSEEYMGMEMFSDDAYRAVFSLQRAPLDILEPLNRHQSLAPLLKKAPPKISELDKELMKGIRQRNLAEISRALAASGRYRNLDMCLYEFSSPCWTLRKPEFVENYLRPEIDSIFPGIADYLSYRNLQEIYRQLCGRLPREERSELEQHNQYYLCCIDGLYRISDGAVLPPDPGLNLFSYLNVRASDIERGDSYYTELFLTNATNGDSALRARLLEMIAVILTAMPLKRFFFLEGPSNTGKGQLIKFLRCLLGNSSCFNVSSINELSRPFTTGNLVDKLMCSCPDIPDETLNAKAIGIIKQIVSDDTVHGEIKFGPSLDFDCYAKLVFASNAPLRVPYHGGKEAFIKRMVHIPFHNSVPEDKQVPLLYQHLLDEAGYVIGLALEQRQEFMKRNCIFTALPDLEWETVQPPVDEQRIVSFIQSCCELIPEAITPVSVLYEAFCKYDMFSSVHPIERSQFSRLLQHGPFQLEGNRTSTYRYICGIRLRGQIQPSES